MAIDGDYAAVGAYRHDKGGDGDPTYTDAGAVYVLYKDPITGWGETQKINHDDRGDSFEFPPSTNDELGIGVGIDGQTIIAGARLEDENALGGDPVSNSGAAYFFSRDVPCSLPFPAVTGLDAEVSESGVILRWNPIIGSAAAGGPTQTVDLIVDNVSEYSVPSSLLSLGTTYNWRVRCGCSFSIGGPWSAFDSFTTLGSGIIGFDSSLDVEFDLFPNPANNHLTLNLKSSNLQNSTVVISDITGRVVIEQIFPQNTSLLTVDVSELTVGIYVVSVVSDHDQMSKRLLISR